MFKLSIYLTCIILLWGCEKQDIIVTDKALRKDIENIEIRPIVADYLAPITQTGGYYPFGKHRVETKLEFAKLGISQGTAYPPDYSNYTLLYHHAEVDLTTVDSFSIFINHKFKKVRVHFSGKIEFEKASYGWRTDAFFCICVPKIPSDYSIEW